MYLIGVYLKNEQFIKIYNHRPFPIRPRLVVGNQAETCRPDV